MKKSFLFLMSFVLLFNMVGFSAILPPTNTNPTTVEQAQLDKLKQFSTMSFMEYEKLLGHKASKVEKYAFTRMQKKTSKMFDSEGNLLQKYQNRLKRMYDEPGGSFVGGFALGFFLGAIGLVLAYAVNNDGDKKNRIKGAWWGFIAAAVLLTILLVVASASVATV
ncbi:MAG: hypothetical protein RL000_2033 [Bacteroidota bacterium]|jgi:hypothetical protein